MIANVILLFAVSVITFVVILKKHPDFLVPFSCFILIFAPLERLFPGIADDDSESDQKSPRGFGKWFR